MVVESLRPKKRSWGRAADSQSSGLTNIILSVHPGRDAAKSEEKKEA
jgi:hypothetical protein